MGGGNTQPSTPTPHTHSCPFHFVAIFLFLEIHSGLCLYFENELAFSNDILPLWSKYLQEHFGNLFPKVWNNCACENCDYLLQCTIYKFPGLFWSWNLHWGYFLIKIVFQWFHQLDHVIFPKNIFRFANFIRFLTKFLSAKL